MTCITRHELNIAEKKFAIMSAIANPVLFEFHGVDGKSAWLVTHDESTSGWHALNVFGFIFSAIWNIFSVAWCCDLNEARSNEINWQPKSYESIIESRQWTEIHRARITTNRSWDNFRWGDETNKSHKSINHTFVVRWRWAERKTKTENISSQSLLVVFVMRLCITRHDEPDSAGFLSGENTRELHAAHSGDFSSQSLAQQAEQIFFCFQMIFSLSVREQKNESRGYK